MFWSNYYAPEEIVHSMAFVPMAAWGADTEIKDENTFSGIYLLYHADITGTWYERDL